VFVDVGLPFVTGGKKEIFHSLSILVHLPFLHPANISAWWGFFGFSQRFPGWHTTPKLLALQLITLGHNPGHLLKKNRSAPVPKYGIFIKERWEH